jgi:hypothetical protein
MRIELKALAVNQAEHNDNAAGRMLVYLFIFAELMI